MARKSKSRPSRVLRKRASFASAKALSHKKKKKSGKSARKSARKSPRKYQALTERRAAVTRGYKGVYRGVFEDALEKVRALLTVLVPVLKRGDGTVDHKQESVHAFDEALNALAGEMGIPPLEPKMLTKAALPAATRLPVPRDVEATQLPLPSLSAPMTVDEAFKSLNDHLTEFSANMSHLSRARNEDGPNSFIQSREIERAKFGTKLEALFEAHVG